MSSLYRKSSESFWHASLGTTVLNYRMLGTDSSGNIYACASSIVLKWSRDGALIWTKTLSGPFSAVAAWMRAAMSISRAATTRAITTFIC